MHAVVIRVTINDQAAAQALLRDEVVPQVSQAPGFVSGHWTLKGDSGMSMIIFESEDAANGVSERLGSMVSDAVAVEQVEVREVVASA